jgi:pimeloyl-ACP methyl ester carboxylesterase
VPRVVAPQTGIELEYEDLGGSGEPLLLVMGLGAQLVHWPDGFCQELAGRGFRVIRFDNRDVGLSSKIRARVRDVRLLMGLRMLNRPFETPYSLLDMADDAAGLLDALGLPSAHIVGLSMGGMIAQVMAIAHPHRVRSLTSVMSGTGGRLALLAKPRALAQLLVPAARNREEAIDNEVAFFRACGGIRAHRCDEPMARDIAGRAYDRCFHPSGFIRQLAAVLNTPDRAPALRYVRVPAAVIHGSADPLILPGAGKATADAIPGARFRLIRDMGHDIPPSTWRPIADEIVHVAERTRQRTPQSVALPAGQRAR